MPDPAILSFDGPVARLTINRPDARNALSIEILDALHDRVGLLESDPRGAHVLIGLTCVCDLTVTHADAKLGFPEVDLGLCPAVIAPWVVRKLGPGVARRAMLMGGVMSGEEAGSIGLADFLAPDRAGLDTLTDEVAQRLSAGGPKALAATKVLLNRLDGSQDRDSVLRGAELSASVLATPEAQAALKSRMTR